MSLIKTLIRNLSPIYSIELINAEYLVSVDANRIDLWDINKGCYVKTLYGHYGVVTCLKKLASNILASAGNEKTIIMWNIENGNLIRNLYGHAGAVYCLEALNSELFASGSKDKNIIIWDINTGDLVKKVKAHDDPVFSLKSLNNNYFSSAGGDRKFKIWDLKNLLCPIFTIEAHKYGAWCMEFIKPNVVALGSDGNIIELWNTENFTLVKTLKDNNSKNFSFHCLQTIS
jgi:WD40 repeat protein